MYLHRMLGGSQLHGNEDRALAKGARKTWQLASADGGVLVLVEIEMRLACFCSAQATADGRSAGQAQQLTETMYGLHALSEMKLMATDGSPHDGGAREA